MLFVERAKATGLPVMATMCFEKFPARVLRGRLAGRLRAQALRRRRRHRRRELPERPGAAAADRRRDAGGRRPATSPRSRSRTARRPSSRTSRRPPNFPYELDPLQLSRKRDGATSRATRSEAGLNYIGSCCGSVAGPRPRDGQGAGEDLLRGRARRGSPRRARPCRPTSIASTPRPRSEPRERAARRSTSRSSAWAGSARARSYWAAKRVGAGVLGLERFELGHERGAVAGPLPDHPAELPHADVRAVRARRVRRVGRPGARRPASRS